MATAHSRLPKRLRDYVSSDTRYLTVPGNFHLDSGACLKDVTIAYRTWGDRKNAEKRAILVCHALTGSADVDEWWPGIIGEQGAFDPRRDFIVCSNILGGCYGTTGPVSPRPDGSGPYRSRFPRITVRDMVRAQRRLTDHLGIEKLDVVTGPSLGGMQALEWAVSYPDRVRGIVPIGVGGRHSPWCIGMSEAQRAAIYADPNWRGGNYSEEQPPEKGLAAARMMAVCTYRSWDSFESRFAREQNDNSDFQVQSYLRYQGQKINRRFDANTYVRLTQAMNEHDVSSGRGDYETVLRSIRQHALVVSVSSDILYPPAEQQQLADRLPNARYAVLDLEDGHDGFLIGTRRLARLIREFRESLRAGIEGPSLRLVSGAPQ